MLFIMLRLLLRRGCYIIHPDNYYAVAIIHVATITLTIIIPWLLLHRDHYYIVAIITPRLSC